MLQLSDIRFTGPALPEPFVRLDLEKELRDLLPKQTGEEGREVQQDWDAYRRQLRELVSQGGPLRVRHCVIEPLAARLGYASIESAPDVATREGAEAGGWLLKTGDGHLRAWTTALGEDLDAPSRRGHAYRFSHLRIAQRVLLATGERVGLLTNGVELRVLISDPSRTDSEIEIPIESHWKRARDVPDSFRLVLALCSPAGLAVLPDLIDKARLKQTGVTKELRRQAREAVELFVQDLLDNPENTIALDGYSDRSALAAQLWHEGLINIFRLLFVLKMESVSDPARAFSFASSTLWRNTYSPSVALAPIVRAVLDNGTTSGEYLEHALRALYRMFTEGLACSEINVKPLGGALFGPDATPLISRMVWGERAVAHLLDRLLWTPRLRGGAGRERVHYGALTVQDLGRIYEALIELEPGIAGEPMCRLRRRKLEVVVPLAQGERYRGQKSEVRDQAEDDSSDESDPSDEEEDVGRAKKTAIDWIEEIPPGHFYLRVGLGRKASGSYYTPDSFVKFLVQETLGPLCAGRSPRDDPQPTRILDLKVADIAMGSGHFLFEACDFLADKLYEACRLCDELAMKAAADAEALPESDAAARAANLAKAEEYRQRVQVLPDPNDEMMAYLPSRAPEDGAIGLSSARALALCKRLVAVHCLYGVDLNPLAVELAKLSLWIETHAEGYPLTFLDHRFVVGNSLTGPFFEHLATYPGTREPMDDLFTGGLKQRLAETLQGALREVRDLESTVGINLGEIKAKEMAKGRLDALLEPFKLLGRAWSGGVMLGPGQSDDQAYAVLAKAVAEGADPHAVIAKFPILGNMIAAGFESLAFDLVFPDVFYRGGDITERAGFDVVLGNPPWDAVRPKAKEFFANFDFRILDAPTKRERTSIEKNLLINPKVRAQHNAYHGAIDAHQRAHEALYQWQVVLVGDSKTGGDPDLAKLFMERNAQLSSLTGVVVPSAFHANEGATGVRRLYLEKMVLRCCYSFENRKKLFDIHRSFKFALVIAGKSGPTTEFPCAFYLHDDGWLFGERTGRELRYTLSFVQKTGGEYLSLLEMKSQEDMQIARLCFDNGEPFGQLCNRLKIRFGRELHMTDDAWRFTPTAQVLPGGEDPRDPKIASELLDCGYFVLHEGKTFWHYEDRWAERPRYIVRLSNITNRPEWLSALPYFRALHRKVSSATNERTAVFCLMPPGSTSGESCIADVTPFARTNTAICLVTGMSNTFVFDWCARLLVCSNFSGYIRDRIPLPKMMNMTLVVSSCLRLTCNHAGYAPLWTGQLGDAWRETKPRHTWPVLEGDDARWAVRAAIDAVVADAYGLTRKQYEHILSAFSHKSYPKAPALCLARFDELKSIGLDAFTKKHDPYWDIPLNEKLPKPVIELPEVGDQKSEVGAPKPKRRGRKKSPGMVREGQADYGPLFEKKEARP